MVAIAGDLLPWSANFDMAAAPSSTLALGGKRVAAPAAQPGGTQLQLMLDSIIIDRFDMAAEQIVAMRHKLQGTAIAVRACEQL